MQNFKFFLFFIDNDWFSQSQSKSCNFIKHHCLCQNRQNLQMSKNKVTKKARRNIYQTLSEQNQPDSISSSFASNAKKQLREISHQIEATKVNEWIFDQEQPSIIPLSHLTNKDINISKFSSTKGNFKFVSKKIDHSLHRRTKTMNSDDSQSSLAKMCNPIQISFYRSVKREKQSRIHSKGIKNLDSLISDKKWKINNIFRTILEKNSKTQASWKEKKNETLSEKKKNSIVYLPKNNLINRVGIKSNNFDIDKKTKSLPIQFNQLQKRKQFLYLTDILQRQKQNIFYPSKAYRTLKIQDKSFSSTAYIKF